jgi:ABC-type uncharacterized transport system substrate-binding protein
VALAPDVILATGTAAMESLLRATRTIPIVFNNVADPVGAGSAFGADRTEQVGRLGPLIVGGTGA